MKFNSIEDRRNYYAKNYSSEFEQGFWNGVNLGYIPDFDEAEQMMSYLEGYRFAKEGNSYAELRAFIFGVT